MCIFVALFNIFPQKKWRGASMYLEGNKLKKGLAKYLIQKYRTRVTAAV